MPTNEKLRRKQHPRQAGVLSAPCAFHLWGDIWAPFFVFFRYLFAVIVGSICLSKKKRVFIETYYILVRNNVMLTKSIVFLSKKSPKQNSVWNPFFGPKRPKNGPKTGNAHISSTVGPKKPFNPSKCRE